MRHWRVIILTLLGLLALVACTPRDTGLWVEPFEKTGEWQLSSDAVADVALVDEQLQIHIFFPNQLAWAAAGRNYRDFHLKVEATQLDGPLDNEYGVLVRLSDDAGFYAFCISSDGFVRAARYDEDGWHLVGPDWEQHEAVKQGAVTNILEIDAQGQVFQFYVNEELVLEVEDNTLAKGDIGLYAGAFGEGEVVIAFDNLEVEALP